MRTVQNQSSPPAVFGWKIQLNARACADTLSLFAIKLAAAAITAYIEAPVIWNFKTGPGISLLSILHSTMSFSGSQSSSIGLQLHRICRSYTTYHKSMLSRAVLTNSGRCMVYFDATSINRL
ncbi:hypothetical protein BJX65DRAFT_268353 [Aspergillus insuetus]